MFRRRFFASWIAAILISLPAAHFLLAAEPGTVKLVIDYGDGAERHFPKIPWQEKQTVVDLFAFAVKHPRGVKVATQGKGELTLVIAIDELKNEGRGKNWVYRVNGKLADRSCGVFELKDGDIVTWKFSDEMP